MPHPLLARAALGGAVLLGASALALPAFATAGQDPPGDNGTIKVHSDLPDDDPSNQPQVACDFSVALFGYDAGESGTITFELWSPSGSGTLLEKHVLLSPDAAGGAGQDPDEAYSFTAEQLGVTGNERVHVRLTVTADDAHGQDKHKVFWLGPCAPEVGGGSTQSPSPSQSPTPTMASPTPTMASPTPTIASPTPTPTTASPTPSPSGSTSTPTPTPSPSASETTTPTPSMSPTGTPAPSVSSTGSAGGTGGTGGSGGTGGGVGAGTVEVGGSAPMTGAVGAGTVGAGTAQGGTEVLGAQYEAATAPAGLLAHTGAAVGTLAALAAALLALGAFLLRRTSGRRSQG